MGFWQKGLFLWVVLASFSTEQLEEKKKFEKRIERFPDDSYAFYRLGRLYSLEGDKKKAQQLLEKSIELDPNNLDAKVTLGYLYLGEEKPFAARSLFVEVLKKSPNYPEVREGIALCDNLIAQLKEEAFQEHLRSKVEVAQALEEKREYLEAVKAWMALREEDPDNPYYDYHIAKNFYALQEYARAETFIQHALEADPENVDYQVVLGFILLRQGEAQKAQRLFERALTKAPEYDDARKGLEEAKQAYHLQQISLKQEEEKSLRLKISQLDEEEKYEQVAEIWEKLVHEYPQNPVYLFELGKAYTRIEHYAAAIKALQHSLQLDPGNGDTLAVLGFAYLGDGQIEKAEATFKSVLARTPRNGDAKLGMRLVKEAFAKREAKKTEALWALMQKADVHEEMGEYAQALAIWEELMLKDPHNAYYFYRLGRLFAAIGEFSKGESFLQQALALDPEDADYKVALAYVWLYQEKREEAIALFEEVLVQAPDLKEAKEGLLLAQSVEPLPEFSVPEVEPEEEIAIEELPVEEYTLEEHALAFEEQGEYEKAAKLWATLAEEASDNAYFYFKEGQNYVRAGQENRAYFAFSKALELDPDNADAKVALAYIYLRSGHEERAERMFQEVLTHYPNYSDAHYGLRAIKKRHRLEQELPHLYEVRELVAQAEAYEKSGQKAQAASTWQELMRLDPTNSHYPYKLGRFYAEQKKPQDAKAYYRLSLELDPQNDDAKVGLAYLLIADGQIDEAEVLFHEVLASSPEYVDAKQGLAKIDLIRHPPPKPPRFTEEQQEWIELAQCYEKKSDYDNAAVIWERAYEENCDDAYFAYQLGKVYALQRKYNRSEVFLERALQLDPKMEEAQFRLGTVYAARGERCQALDVYRALAEEKPENGDYLEALGRSLRALNAHSDAKEIYLQRFTLGDPHYGLFKQHNSTLERTNPSAVGTMLYAQERETDIITRLLSAQRNTAVAILSYNKPIFDTFQVKGMILASTVRELNLIAGVNNLFIKTQDYRLLGTWNAHPQLVINASMDYQVGRDIGDPRFPIGHRYRLLPSVAANYSAPAHFMTVSLEYDTLLIKDFVASPLKGNLLRRMTVYGRDEHHVILRHFKVGTEGFYRYYEGDPYNRQWQGAIYAQGGLPKYAPCFFLRYWGQVGGFTTNQTVYYSYKRQWQHSAFLIFSKKVPLNMEIDFALEQAWQWNRKLNQPVNTLVFINKLFRSYERLFFEVRQLYRPNTEFTFKTTAYWDSTKYTTWDVKGNLTHVF
ncbi:MAG: tetratricopeptide repeat protein [Chlamydiales bacterium]|nr:tetratricopeptide repeat protein [Chlamydiales bacterium]